MAKVSNGSTKQAEQNNLQEQEPLVKTHFVPPAKINTEYRSRITTKLIHSIDELRQALKNNTVVAWDTETTGLNPERSEIVGFSFSYDGKEAYYCPVKHVDIALGKESLSLFIESLKTSPCSFLYNARFDIRVMEYSGFDMSFLYPKDPSTGQSSPRFIDVMNSVWLSDTNFPLPSLKSSTLHFLGYQPPKFLETLGEAESFQYLTAEKAYDYAALDAANTYNLALVTMRYHKEAGLAANLDTATIYIIGQLEKTPIKMDTQYLKDLRDRTYQDVLDLEKRIYSYAGRSFKIGSNRELTKVFESLGIDTGERTKAHDMKTGIDLLQAYLRDHPDTPIITDLIQYKEKFKFYNSYLKTLVDVAENQEEFPPRFNYKLQAVPTSRLACGKDGKNTYFAPLNLQCLKHDTRVLTPNGLKPISEIKDGDLVWDGQDFSVCNQLGSREKEIIKVECGHNHYLEASREHQVYAYHNSKIGWFSLGELEEGDFLAVNRKSPEKDDTRIPISIGQIPRPKGGLPRKEIHVDRPMMDFWFLCGYFVGDGYFIKDKDHFRGVGILVPDNKIDAKGKLLSGFLEVGITPFEKFSKKENYKDILVLVTKSVAFTELLLSLGFKHKAENKVIPDIIFSLSPRQKLSFIDGLLSSDGHVGKSIEYKTVSIDLAESFRNLLETLGYFSTFRGSRKTGYYLLVHDKNRFKKESGITVKYKNDSIIGTRRRNGLPRDFYKSLPSSITSKVPNDPDLLYQNGVEEAKFYYKKITSIQPMGIETTYDLYVPNTNRFTANGFIVHNSIPKPQSNKSFGRPATQEEIDNHEDLLGWVFSPDHPEWSPGKCVEGMCPDDNVRRAFLPEHPENGDYVISVDMCAEELRVVTNLFSEQSWARVINAGGDLHHANSDAIFGAENYTKETRKMAKAAAFGILYGQEYRGFQQHFPSMTLDEAKDFMIKFKRTIPSIVQGQQRMIRDAKRTGIIYSYFGHPRRVKQYFSSPNFRDVAFGERTVKNNPIQSTSADVLKIELIRLWDNLFTKYPQVKFICTIHDEVNYSVPRSLAAEVIPIIIKCMTVKMPNWIVPLDCSLSVGSTLGGLIPFKYDFATKTFTPEWEEYKAKTVVVEEPKEVLEVSSTKDDIEEIDSLMFDLS